MSDYSGHGNPKTGIQASRFSAFVSYSQKDKRYLQEFQEHLAYYAMNWNIQIWDDTKIQPGADRDQEISKAMKSAAIAVLLVSPDYLASEHIVKNELPVLLSTAKEEGLIILCVILRDCAFDFTELARFEPVNVSSNPLSKMTLAQRDEIWKRVAESLWVTLSSKRAEVDTNQVQKNFSLSRSREVLAPSRSLSTSPAANIHLVRQPIVPSEGSVCDICIACAMEEEVRVFMRETTRLYQVTFHSVMGRHKRQYLCTTIHNNRKEPLTLYLTWPPAYGPDETASHFQLILDELKPRFTAMTGICAGDKEKVALGDIVIAERAFRSDTGKIVKRGGKKQQLYDTNTRSLDQNILHFVRLFDGWIPAVSELKRPISKRQQRDWLLSTLLKTRASNIKNIPAKERDDHVPDWQLIVYQLMKSSPRFLNDDGTLCDPTQVRDLYFEKEKFPFQDPRLPVRHIAPMASSSVVHSDDPFEEIRVPVRGTLAVDMEAATFYHTVANCPNIRSLVVKGVSDYANKDKDNSYHEYAAAVSSIYVLCFIQEYVNDEYMPA